MNSEILERATEIKDKIDSLTNDLNKVNRLLKSCGLSCEITGTPRASFTRTAPYKLRKTSILNSVLSFEKENIEAEIGFLKHHLNDI